MKKILAVIAALFCFAGVTFADELEELQKNPNFVDVSTRSIVPEDQHTTNKTAKVLIEYTPLTDEVHIYYTCVAVTYDQGEAMNTVLACLQDFQKENQYFSYKYLRKDSVKYFKDDKNMKWATYQSYVKFNR
ncbi:hypothetical protein [uncultured Treponema sp.]|uniref:hypothetical protein n=1 Tax=uncultured Treponema sp. TaxID=162155 RepID=UPI0025D7CEB8|nr:hypothetical protein [uncultured Treponema sp.]